MCVCVCRLSPHLPMCRQTRAQALVNSGHTCLHIVISDSALNIFLLLFLFLFLLNLFLSPFSFLLSPFFYRVEREEGRSGAKRGSSTSRYSRRHRPRRRRPFSHALTYSTVANGKNRKPGLGWRGVLYGRGGLQAAYVSIMRGGEEREVHCMISYRQLPSFFYFFFFLLPRFLGVSEYNKKTQRGMDGWMMLFCSLDETETAKSSVPDPVVLSSRAYIEINECCASCCCCCCCCKD